MKRRSIAQVSEDVYLSVLTTGAHALPFDPIHHNKPALHHLHKKALHAARQAKKGVSLLRGTKTPAMGHSVSASGALGGSDPTTDPFENIFGRERLDVGEYEVYLESERGNEEEPDFCATTLRGAIAYARRQCALDPTMEGESFVIEAVGMPLVSVSAAGVVSVGWVSEQWEWAQKAVAELLTWEEVVAPLVTPLGKDD